MRFMTEEAWDEFGYSLETAINTLSSHRPSPEVEAAKLKLKQAMNELTTLGVFSESFNPGLTHY